MQDEELFHWLCWKPGYSCLAVLHPQQLEKFFLKLVFLFFPLNIRPPISVKKTLRLHYSAFKRQQQKIAQFAPDKT